MAKSKEKYILNILRQGTITWSGRNNCFSKNATRVITGTYKNKKEKTKYFWKCEKCKMTSPDKLNFEVDHIKEIGGFKGSWDKIISVMYDENNLQLLCIECHAKKTSKYNATLTYTRKTAE
jgi:5-methylcytosine-specific restriction endonuclease McrA